MPSVRNIRIMAMTSWIDLARSVVVLNQYCSETSLKILFNSIGHVWTALDWQELF